MIFNKTKFTILASAPLLAATLALTPNVSADEVSTPAPYIVQSGDTLTKISEEKFGTIAYADEIAYVNGIENPDLIFTGQELKFDNVTTIDLGSIALPFESLEKTYEEYSYDTSYVEPAYQATYVAPVTESYDGYSSGVVLANGNTPGAIGSYAAAQMAARTGVPASTWEHIIARESNGQVDAYNPSGASGLFQTMPGWGSTATVEDQINAALNAYNNQGLAAWGY